VPFGQLLARQVERPDEERVGVRDRLRAEADAEDVADHAADARARAAVGIDRARVVVRLDLEAHVRALVELDDAGVVVEDADAPGRASSSVAALIVLLEQVVDAPRRRSRRCR
jgi:hypothetical protein